VWPNDIGLMGSGCGERGIAGPLRVAGGALEGRGNRIEV